MWATNAVESHFGRENRILAQCKPPAIKYWVLKPLRIHRLSTWIRLVCIKDKKHALNRYMNRAASSALRDVDLVVFCLLNVRRLDR